MRVLSCVNQKGGVGKTTLCANIAASMAQSGANVLAIDMDPQGHLASYLGVRERDLPGVFDVLQGDVSISAVARPISSTLSLVPGGKDLLKLESVQMKPGRGLRLRKAIADMRDKPDIVVIDCPASNGFLVVNAIAASKELVVPVTADFLGLSGLSDMTRLIQRYETVMGKFNRVWVVLSRYQRRKLSEEAAAKIKHYFKDKVVPTVIHERTAVAESPGHGSAVVEYAPKSKGAGEFHELAKFLMEHP